MRAAAIVAAALFAFGPRQFPARRELCFAGIGSTGQLAGWIKVMLQAFSSEGLLRQAWASIPRFAGTQHSDA